MAQYTKRFEMRVSERWLAMIDKNVGRMNAKNPRKQISRADYIRMAVNEKARKYRGRWRKR